MNIDTKILNNIKKIANKYDEISKISLFGSRAREDNLKNSDIDLAIYSSRNFDRLYEFSEDINNIETLLSFDIILFNNTLNEKIIQNIKTDEVIIMDKLRDKLVSFNKAIVRLSESILEYEKTKSLVARDGVIQRFEFSSELAWKTLKEYLINEEFTGFDTPKSVIKKAYSLNLIENENVWLQIYNDRNLTSHT